MASNYIETYSYIEEEEVEIPNNAVGVDTNWGEFGNIQMEVEPDIHEDGKIKKKAAKTVVRKATSSKKRKQNLSAFASSLETIDPSKIVTVVSTELGNEESEVKNLKSSPALFDGNALFDGTFFTFIGEYYIQSSLNQTLIRKFKGKCELCQSPVYIVGSGSSTYNFLRHLKRKHGQKSYDSYISYKLVKSPNKVRPPRPKILDIVKKSASSTAKILGTVNIHVFEGYAWNQFGNPKNKRALNSIILADGISEKILNDVKDFLRSSAWYIQHSVPYRRTFLLHGPSGCGKSSFVFALASELNFGLCVLYASDRELTDSKLNHLLNTAPENCIILLEDIDAVFPTPECKEQSNQLTLSGILNCLDGVTAPEGRILIMTCTDKDRLDPSLLRPGRVDVKEHFGFCSQNQITHLFKKFCGDTASCAMEFTEEVIKHGRSVSPAQLQGFFSFNKRGDVEKLKLDVERIWDF